MADYIMPGMDLQEQKIGELTVYVDSDTGEVVESLHDNDKKFEWRERKKGSLRLADALDFGGLDKYAERAKTCSTWLEYLASADLSKRELHKFNPCHFRLCPVCSARKARIMAKRLEKVLEKVLADHKGTQLIFLTLTVRNCDGDELRVVLDLLMKAWGKLRRRTAFIKAVKGWFRAVEVTRNRKKDNYHPHIHAILVVEDAYFVKSSPLYITQARWKEMWQESLKIDYEPIVYVEKTTSKDGKSKELSAAVEAAKYATKSKEYISEKLSIREAAKVAAVYTQALNRKRMTAMGGWVADVAAELALDVEGDDTDLVHDEDGNGELTVETAELLEDYGWHFGVSDHVLTSRRPNPDFGGGGADE